MRVNKEIGNVMDSYGSCRVENLRAGELGQMADSVSMGFGL
jgi:hypothetical protein